MGIVKWTPDYLLGISDIDEHHRHLFDLLNKTYDMFVAGKSKDELSNILDELIDYATCHFAAEEVLMVKNHYPNYEQHHELHQTFSQRINEIQKDYLNGRTELSLEILSFLKNWITDHVLVKDADYGNYITDKG